MINTPALFVCVTAAETARSIPELLERCVQAGWTVYTIASPNVALVMPLNTLLNAPGCGAIRAYGDPPLDRFPFGTLLIAPCTFNTLNKLAHGMADNLLTAMVADALGRRCPIFIAPSMNHGLWQHPQTQTSLQRLQNWGCQIIGPLLSTDKVEMVSVATIFQQLDQHFSSATKAGDEPV